MLVTALLDGKALPVQDAMRLRSLLAEPELSEVWRELGEAGPRLCALISGGVGWLMYLARPGDSGMSSRNPAYRGPSDAVVAYRLSNGQVDEYPASWAYPRAAICDALVEFATTGERSATVEWHVD